jgi:amicyanin
MMHIYTRKTSPTSKHRRRAWYIILALAALVLLAACGGDNGSGTGTTPTVATGNTPTPVATTPTTPGNTMAVTIINASSNPFAFSPDTLTIKVGTTVTWTNRTTAPHTVTSDDGTSFDSGISNPIAPSGGTYSHTFNKAGTFAYHCMIHPVMKAMIIVQ